MLPVTGDGIAHLFIEACATGHKNLVLIVEGYLSSSNSEDWSRDPPLNIVEYTVTGSHKTALVPIPVLPFQSVNKLVHVVCDIDTYILGLGA